MATSFTLKTAPRSTVHQALGDASITVQLPTFSTSGLLLPSTAKDAPRPPLTADSNVGLPSATFVNSESNQRHQRRVSIVHCEVNIARRMKTRKHPRSREQEEKRKLEAIDIASYSEASTPHDCSERTTLHHLKFLFIQKTNSLL